MIKAVQKPKLLHCYLNDWGVYLWFKRFLYGKNIIVMSV